MINYLRQVSLLFLLTPSLVFAHGGGMEVMVIWFYTLVVIMHGAIVFLLRNLLIYNYLWLVIVSVFFSVSAMVLWVMLLSIVKFMPNTLWLAVASYLGLIIYFSIVIWAIITPIKQYRKMKGEADQ